MLDSTKEGTDCKTTNVVLLLLQSKVCPHVEGCVQFFYVIVSTTLYSNDKKG